VEIAWQVAFRFYARALARGSRSPSHRTVLSPERGYFTLQLASSFPLSHALALTSTMQLCTQPIPLPHGARASPFRPWATHVRAEDKSRKAEACLCSDFCLARLVSFGPSPCFFSHLILTFLSSHPPARSMASSSNSASPPNPPPSLELEIRKLKRTLSAHRGFLLRLDGEGD
jgi:hypothetical protein